MKTQDKYYKKITLEKARRKMKMDLEGEEKKECR